MPVSLHHIVVDAHDLGAQARFWAAVLDWAVVTEREREVIIGPDADAASGICFMPVSDPKQVKTRLLFDLNPHPGTTADEVERILGLGARRIDVGQAGSESWTVLADPEGNEFCVVRPKATLAG
jgi:predicted enzyme related to lactoylglutathione lyase